jgi:hypothetical protein
MSVGLPHQLLVYCRKTLESCRECESHQNLLAVFVAEELAPFKIGLPEANSTKERVSRCISYLLPCQHAQQKRSVFVIFLEILSTHQPEADALRQKLSQLAQDVQAALKDQRVQSAEARAYQDAVVDFGLNTAVPTDAQPSEASPAAQWLEAAKQDTDDWAFRIALAVFNGAQYTECARAARDLAERLRPPPPSKAPDVSTVVADPTLAQPGAPTPITLTPPQHPLIKRLGAANAKREEKEIVIGNPAEVQHVWTVQLNDPTLPAAALTYLWMEYIDWHEHLVEWLTQFAANQPTDIRTHAVIAAGVLAITDFATIKKRLLVPWAKETNTAYRTAIGQALGIVVANDRRADEARGLLKGWSNAKERALRLAAAHAYIYVGAKFTEDAIKQWQVIARSEDLQLIEGAEVIDGTSMAIWWDVNPLHRELFSAIRIFIRNSIETADADRRAIFTTMVLGIQEWVDADQKVKRASGTEGLGMSVFLELGYWLVLSDVEPATRVPLLLTLVEPNGPCLGYRAALADLLYQALLSQSREMLDILRIWLEYADGDRRYEQQLFAILQDVVAREGHGQQGRIWNRLMLHLRDWATHRSAPLPTARRAYNQLRTMQAAA